MNNPAENYLSDLVFIALTGCTWFPILRIVIYRHLRCIIVLIWTMHDYSNEQIRLKLKVCVCSGAKLFTRIVSYHRFSNTQVQLTSCLLGSTYRFNVLSRPRHNCRFKFSFVTTMLSFYICTKFHRNECRTSNHEGQTTYQMLSHINSYHSRQCHTRKLELLHL